MRASFVFIAVCFASAYGAPCPGATTQKCIYGTAIKKIAAASAAACCQACVDANQRGSGGVGGSPPCAGWQYGASCKYCSPATPCVLKSDVPNTYDDNCTSAVLVPGPHPSPPAPTPAPAPAPTGLQFAPLFIGVGGAVPVMQHGSNAAVWGTGAPPGSAVRLDITGAAAAAAATATADANGYWIAQLPAQHTRWNATLVASAGNATATTVVSFGEVVLCSGQSNMAMPVSNKPGGFQADNGTAECAAAPARYGGKISLVFATSSKYHHVPSWTGVDAASLGKFSAVCWYTGKELFERLGGDTPVGLVTAAVGGSPIEYWLPPDSAGRPNANECEIDRPQCDNQYNDSTFFVDIIGQLSPFAIGSIVWDQAERDVKCPVSVAAYACMQRALVAGYRQAFRSPRAPFVAVQLPGYTGALNNGTGTYPGYISAAMVFNMRLQQEAGARGVANASVVATYDRSCAASAQEGCPFGSVHNVDKTAIGARVAASLHAMLAADSSATTEGPRATSARVVGAYGRGRRATRRDGLRTYEIEVSFAGGTMPLVAQPTKNCTTCCDADAAAAAAAHGTTLDFDATWDGGASWVNASSSHRIAGGGSGSARVSINVTLPSRPTGIRYTAASIFPQCALFNQEGLPALPFAMNISTQLQYK